MGAIAVAAYLRLTTCASPAPLLEYILIGAALLALALFAAHRHSPSHDRSLYDPWRIALTAGRRTGIDEIGNAAGYRISKSHVATATGVHRSTTPTAPPGIPRRIPRRGRRHQPVRSPTKPGAAPISLNPHARAESLRRQLDRLRLAAHQPRKAACEHRRRPPPPHRRPHPQPNTATPSPSPCSISPTIPRPSSSPSSNGPSKTNELILNPQLQEQGLRFDVDVLANATADLQIKLALTERVRVTLNPDGTHTAEHLPEPIDPTADWVWTIEFAKPELNPDWPNA